MYLHMYKTKLALCGREVSERWIFYCIIIYNENN